LFFKVLYFILSIPTQLETIKPRVCLPKVRTLHTQAALVFLGCRVGIMPTQFQAALKYETRGQQVPTLRLLHKT
ncbi:TPA: hypothetical protein ACTC36_002025, partial [Neisseria meningitidis]|uniref:hypothetical protein n=1 Tax=Neisseria meningitidis TaxID=487 RepID=UPI003602A47C